MKVNTYRHKGYWYHNRGRELPTMEFFASLIQTGDTVIEAGGHIGYITQYYSRLVGEEGRVAVFEPGCNNASYIDHNVRGLSNVVLERIAVASENGTATFYEDNVTGQNNSLLSDYEGAELAAMWWWPAPVLSTRGYESVNTCCSAPPPKSGPLRG